MTWPGSVDFHRVVTREQVRRVRADIAPSRSGPANKAVAVVAAQEQIVGNIELSRARVLRPDAESHVLEPAVAYRQIRRARKLLLAGEHRHVGIAEGDAVEDVVGRADDIEQHVIARAVENDLAVARGFDRDRLFGGALQGQIECAIEGRSQRIDVIEAFRPVQAGVNQQRIARLRLPLPNDAPVAEPGAVIGFQNAGECRFLARAFMLGRVNVQRAPAGIGLRFRTCAQLQGSRRLARCAVRIGERQTDVVFRAGLQIQNRSGETVRDDVFQVLAVPANLLATDAEER